MIKTSEQAPVPRVRPKVPARLRPTKRLLSALTISGALLLGLAASDTATAQTSRQERSREVLAAEIRDRLEGIRQELIKSARDTQSSEAMLAESETRLEGLTALHAARAGDLSQLRGRLASLTAAMQRLARRPPEAILTSSRPPLETARAMMLIRFLVPDIKSEADMLRGELAKIETINQQVQAERERFQTASLALQTRRDQLNDLIDRKNSLWQSLNAARTPADQLERSSDTLAELLAALKKQGDARAAASEKLKTLMASAPAGLAKPAAPARPVISSAPASGGSPPARAAVPEPATRPSGQTAVSPAVPQTTVTPVPATGSFAASKGRLTAPVFGRLVERFGETDELGLTAKGITVRTRPNAPVVAMHDGKVIYAGPFRGYGRIIIIEHGQGFLTLLAGLERIDVRAGQGVLAGEPVGTMKGPAEVDDARSKQLYIEIRRNGTPVDPLAWLSTQRDTAIQ